jgi:hypothetical protein
MLTEFTPHGVVSALHESTFISVDSHGAVPQ